MGYPARKGGVPEAKRGIPIVQLCGIGGTVWVVDKLTHKPSGVVVSATTRSYKVISYDTTAAAVVAADWDAVQQHGGTYPIYDLVSLRFVLLRDCYATEAQAKKAAEVMMGVLSSREPKPEGGVQ